jgi:hypothetical protein
MTARAARTHSPRTPPGRADAGRHHGAWLIPTSNGHANGPRVERDHRPAHGSSLRSDVSTPSAMSTSKVAPDMGDVVHPAAQLQLRQPVVLAALGRRDHLVRQERARTPRSWPRRIQRPLATEATRGWSCGDRTTAARSYTTMGDRGPCAAARSPCGGCSLAGQLGGGERVVGPGGGGGEEPVHALEWCAGQHAL